MRRPVDPLFVSGPVGEYEDPAWPVNPWANRDADLLADRFGGSAVKAYGFQGRERFRALLAWLGGDAGAAGGRPHRPGDGWPRMCAGGAGGIAHASPLSLDGSVARKLSSDRK